MSDFTNITLLQFLNLFDDEDIRLSLVDYETNEELLQAWYSDVYDTLVGTANYYEFLREKEYFVKGFDFINDILVIDVL